MIAMELRDIKFVSCWENQQRLNRLLILKLEGAKLTSHERGYFKFGMFKTVN